MRLRRHAFVFAALIGTTFSASVTAPSANATTFKYSYTGQPFTSCNGTYPANCANIGVTGFFTTANALVGSLNNSQVSPLSFSFTDGGGVIQLTSSTPLAISDITVSTDVLGNISAWGINLANFATQCASVSGFECLGSYSNPNGAGDFSAYGFNLNTPSQSFGGGTNQDTPGSWVETELSFIDEPSSLELSLSGLFVFLLCARLFGHRGRSIKAQV